MWVVYGLYMGGRSNGLNMGMYPFGALRRVGCIGWTWFWRPFGALRRVGSIGWKWLWRPFGALRRVGCLG